MDEASKSAWCRANGDYPQELEVWRENAMSAIPMTRSHTRQRSGDQAEPAQDRGTRARIRCKDMALAETATLLVLSKKVAAFFNKDMGEDE